MDKTKIDWCDMSWNPITGCKHGCTYCYARRIAERFGGYDGNGGITTFNPLKRAELSQPLTVTRENGKTVKAPYPFGFEPTLHRYRLEEAARKQRGRNIFVGSMADVFGNWVPVEWIVAVLDACAEAPQHNYLFLTKNPERYRQLNEVALLPRERNFWYGTTVTNTTQASRADSAMSYMPDETKTFYSMEPLLEDVAATKEWRSTIRGECVDWIIIGAATGPEKEKLQLKREWVQRIVDDAHAGGIPVFMKGHLAGVWGDELIREFPPELAPGRGNHNDE